MKLRSVELRDKAWCRLICGATSTKLGPHSEGFAHPSRQSSGQQPQVRWGPVDEIEVETSEGVDKYTCRIECDYCGGHYAKAHMQRVGKLTWFCSACAPVGEAIMAMGLYNLTSSAENVVNVMDGLPFCSFPANECDTNWVFNFVSWVGALEWAAPQ